jgi:uncharacterized membrane protein YccC
MDLPAEKAAEAREIGLAGGLSINMNCKPNYQERSDSCFHPFSVEIIRMTHRFASIRDLRAGLRQEAAAFSLRGPRATRATRTLVSVGLAIALAHYLGTRDNWWVAISAFIVMQADFDASVRRALLRVFGTLCGAVLGVVAGLAIGGHPVPLVVLLGVATWAGLFCALALAHSYAWVLGTVTFLMIALEAMHGRSGLKEFAWARVVDIVIGSAACVIVAAVCDARVRQIVRTFVSGKRDSVSPALPVVPDEPRPDFRAAGLHALDGAIAVVFLAAFSCIASLRSFPQAMVTAIAVLVVPLVPGATQAHKAVMQKMQQRLTGCLIAAAIALALLPLIRNQPLLCQLTLYLGIWIGAYLQTGVSSVRYMGTQFAIAIIMAFVQDRGWAVDDIPVAERLAGVCAGIAGLMLTFWATRRVHAIADRPITS